jgi:5-methylcytosine-specific restriction endonuclease McrA
MSAHHRTPEWKRVVAQVKPQLQAQVQAGSAVCIDCGQPVVQGQRWDVGHRVAASKGGTNHPSNLGASHSRCNRAAGARMTHTITRTQKRKDKGLFEW